MIAQVNHSRRRRGDNRGFTLIELMVVVTIIAILAGIGIPKMTAFIRSARATEATKQLARISESVDAYSSLYPTTNIFATYKKLPGTDSDSLTKARAELKLDDNAKFSYELMYTDSDTYCIVATHTTETYKIYFSKLNMGGTAPGWDDNINNVNFVSAGEQTPVLTGSDCASAG